MRARTGRHDMATARRSQCRPSLRRRQAWPLLGAGRSANQGIEGWIPSSPVNEPGWAQRARSCATGFTSEQVKAAVEEGYAWLGGLAELRHVIYVDLPTSHSAMWSRPRELTGIIGDVAKAHAPGAWLYSARQDPARR